MVSLLIDRLKNSNKKVHEKIVEWFSSPDYRSNVFVDEILAQLARYMDEQNISDSDLAKRVGVNKSAVSQLFDSNGNIKVKTLFKYADKVNLTLQSPKLIHFNSNDIYQKFKAHELSDISVIHLKDYNKQTTSALSDTSERLNLFQGFLETTKNQEQISTIGYTSNNNRKSA